MLLYIKMILETVVMFMFMLYLSVLRLRPKTTDEKVYIE